MSTAPFVGAFLISFLFSIGYLAAFRERSPRCSSGSGSAVLALLARADGRSARSSGGRSCPGSSCSSTWGSRRRSGRAPWRWLRSSSGHRVLCFLRTPRLRLCPRNSWSRAVRSSSDPILIAAFRGWNDGGQGASLATGYLAKLWDATRFAEIEPENFFDFQATRPHVSLEDGVTRRIDWPSTVFYHGRPPGQERDVVLLLGIEPNLRWQTFTDLIVDFIKELGGRARRQPGRAARGRAAHAALPGDGQRERPGARRTARPLRLAVRGADRDRGRPPRRVPPGRASVREPLGGGAPLRLADPEPEGGARALRTARPSLIEIDIDTTELAEAAANYSEQVSEAVAADPDTASYIEELEQRADTLAEEAELPSGDTLAAELTQFLRDRERDNGDDDVTRGHEH